MTKLHATTDSLNELEAKELCTNRAKRPPTAGRVTGANPEPAIPQSLLRSSQIRHRAGDENGFSPC